MPTEVDIPPRYVRMAKQIAKRRNEYFEKNTEWNNPEVRDGDPLNDNFIGVLGELAFAIHSDLKVDASTFEIRDPGWDFEVVKNGELTTIDVKTVRKEPIGMWVKEHAMNADSYVLAHVRHEPEGIEGWEVELQGWASRERVQGAIRVKSRLGFVNRSIAVEALDPVPKPGTLREQGSALSP